MTLTTEMMQEIYEVAVHSEASGSESAEFELLCKLEDVGGTGATIRKLIDMVRAANREARPVECDGIFRPGDAVGVFNVGCETCPDHLVAWTVKGKSLPVGNYWLYTAPPAPAVPDGYCVMPLTLTAANGAKGALSGEFKVSRMVRCHECGGEGCDDCADAGEFEEEITVPWDTIKDIYRAAVDTCRAAMLAQPVSQGYKLPDSVLVLLNHIEDVLDDENWNRISVKKWNAVTMLAAAPWVGMQKK